MLKISIVTISFNQGKFLEEAIVSVLRQNYDNTEYIIIDAGSKDNSRSIIENYRHCFKHVVLEPDNGPADGLNKGLALCTGDIFCYLNADDKFEEGAFKFVNDFFERNENYDGLIGSAYIIDENGRRKRRKALSKSFDLKNILNHTALAIQQATFLKLGILNKHNIHFNTANFTCWDSELLIDFCIKGARIATTFKTLGAFRIYPDSITGSSRLKNKYDQDNSRINQKLEQLGYIVKGRSVLISRIIRLNPYRILQSYLK